MKKLIIWTIVILSLAPLFWFKDNLLIAGGDHSVFLNPLSFLNKLYLWTEFKGNGLGSVSHDLVQYCPFILFFQGLNAFGISLVTVEKMWFIFIFLFTGFSMYFLYVQVIGSKDSIGAFFSAIFYMFNLYSLVSPPVATQSRLVYAGLPLVLALFLKGLNSSKPHKYVVLVGLASLFYSGAIINPALYFPTLLAIFVIFVSFLAVHRPKDKLRRLFFLMKTIVFMLIVNLWAIYPRFVSIHNIISTRIPLAPPGPWAISSTHLYQAFRLMGQWCWPLSHFYRFYDNNLFLGLGYLFPIVVFSALFLRINNKNVYCFMFLAIVGLFVVKGINPTLGGLYKWAYYNIPGFVAFREPYTKFTCLNALAYAVLFGFVIDRVWIFLFYKDRVTAPLKLVNLKKFLFLFTLITLLLVNVWPVFTNYYIVPGGKNQKPWHVKVPKDWTLASTWLSEQDGEFKILELPKDNGYGMEFNWKHGFNGTNPSRFLFDKPVVGTVYTGGIAHKTNPAKLVNAIYDSFYEGKTANLSKILGILNIKYLHLRADIGWQKCEFTSPETNRKAIEKQKNIELTKIVGTQEFYLNKDFFPLIYGTRHIRFLKGNISNHTSLSFIDEMDMTENPAFVFEDELDKNQRAFLVFSKFQSDAPRASALPEIQFRKINPTKYEVRFESSEPFVLVFGESYHSGWVAYYEDNTRVNNHFVINGYGNGFVIDRVDKRTVILEFVPQRLAYMTIAISLTVIIISILYLILRFLKRAK